jgi:pSer/pThr/pTyr-binding forkhead associated (FHA) protein
MEKGERVGQEFRLHEGDTSIGRAGTNDIVLEDPTVSRQQAKIRLEGDEFYIYDLGATNPTRVNGRVITKQKLADGDRVEMGNTVFVFKRA